MNLFKEIKWDNLRLNGFLEDDHIRKHSFTYKLLSDQFKVPKHLKHKSRVGGNNEGSEEEFEDNCPAEEDGDSMSHKNGLVDVGEQERKSDYQPNTKKRRYVPGIVCGLPFPKCSSLTKEEQRVYIELHSMFVNKTFLVSSTISMEQQKQFATYIELNNRVTAERAEFQTFLKEQWKITSTKFNRLSSDVEHYISESWQHRIDTRLSPYMRYYNKTKLVPLVYQGEKSDVQLIAGDLLLQLGTYPFIINPNSKSKTQIYQDAVMVSKRYPPNCKQPNVDTSNTIHKLPVSADVNARQLALAYDADIVISSSGLKAIADNHSEYGRLWDLPVVVERYEPVNKEDPPRRVVYVDRPLPKQSMTVSDRNLRFHKLGVKALWCHPRHQRAFRFQPQRGEQESGGNSGKRRKVEADRQEESKPDAILNTMKTESDAEEKYSSKQTFMEPAPYTNVSYRLWTMKKEKGKKEELPRHMMKQPTGTPDRDLTILVRNKLDGFVHAGRNKDICMPVTVLPKLEHQSEYGAEKMTRAEQTNEWLTLKFREGSTLTRVRINAETSEVLVTESLTLGELTQEAKRNHGPTFVSDITSTLYCVLNGLADLAPGQYLLTHSSVMQAFALLQQGQQGFGNLDLKERYSSVDTRAEPLHQEEMPWIEVDTAFMMPHHVLFNRVPGTFNPPRVAKPPPDTPASTSTSTKQPPKQAGKNKNKKSKKG